MTSRYGLLMAPISGSTQVPFVDVDTGLDLVIPAGQCLLRLCVFQSSSPEPLTPGLNFQIGTSGSPGAYIGLLDALTSGLLNSNIAFNKTIISFTASASDITPVITLSSANSAGAIWVEFAMTNN